MPHGHGHHPYQYSSPTLISSMFTLLLQDRPILCSRRLIANSCLFMDMCELVEYSSPIPITAFISRQIMLDQVKMVRRWTESVPTLS